MEGLLWNEINGPLPWNNEDFQNQLELICFKMQLQQTRMDYFTRKIVVNQALSFSNAILIRECLQSAKHASFYAAFPCKRIVVTAASVIPSESHNLKLHPLLIWFNSKP